MSKHLKEERVQAIRDILREACREHGASMVVSQNTWCGIVNDLLDEIERLKDSGKK